MEINKKTRTELKDYFKANDRPTDKQFAAFIDAGINQAEDSIVKEEGSPLAIQAEAGTQEVLDLYTSFTKNSPNWSLNLNPRVNPEDPMSNQSGLNIKDTTGQSRLFIKSQDGSIGIGTIEPQSKLTIQGENNKSSLAVMSNTQQNAKIFEVTQKEGDGMLAIRNANKEDVIGISGTKGGASFFLNKVGIGTENPRAPLSILGTGNSTDPDEAMHITNSSILFGGSNAQGSAKSAKIIVDETSLKIYGKTVGTNSATRKIDLFSEGGMQITGNIAAAHKLDIAGKLTAKADLEVQQKLTVKGNMTVETFIKTPINQVVAFSASLNAKMGTKNVIPFGLVHYNYGGHFQNKTHFTAPVKGLYVFRLCLRATTNDGTIWYLKLNDDHYVNGSGTGETHERSMVSTTKSYHTSSRSITTLLEVGDRVHIRQSKGASDGYSSGFEGFLLQALV